MRSAPASARHEGPSNDPDRPSNINTLYQEGDQRRGAGGSASTTSLPAAGVRAWALLDLSRDTVRDTKQGRTERFLLCREAGPATVVAGGGQGVRGRDRSGDEPRAEWIRMRKVAPPAGLFELGEVAVGQLDEQVHRLVAIVAGQFKQLPHDVQVGPLGTGHERLQLLDSRLRRGRHHRHVAALLGVPLSPSHASSVSAMGSATRRGLC